MSETAFDANARWQQAEDLIRREFESWPAEFRRTFAHDLGQLAGELLGECPDETDGDDEAPLSLAPRWSGDGPSEACSVPARGRGPVEGRT